jgi:hypothetical protein
VVIELALGIVAQAIISSLASTPTGRMSNALITKLEGDQSKKAFKQAIALAINDYAHAASGHRKLLTRALMEENGFLADPSVVAEIAKLVRFDGPPDPKIVGQCWKKNLEYPPIYIDFTKEAEILLNCIRSELEESDIFRPVFQSKSLDNIATNAALSDEKLSDVVNKLQSIYELTSSRLAEIIKAIEKTSPDIRNSIIDYSDIIEEKTRDFVGRKFIIQSVEDFVARNDRGYILIRGDPGIGKTALVSQMVRQSGYLHHFNIRSMGTNKARHFLRNICAQLIAYYNMNYNSLPEEAEDNSRFLSKLLIEASNDLKADERILIAVDALDEIEETNPLSSGVNALYLPPIIPPKVYFVLTMRRVELNLRFECANRIINIEHDSEENMEDVHQYIENRIGKSEQLQAFIDSNKLTRGEFKERIVRKSQGNFMYLRYVLSDIERGAYLDVGLDAIPEGLQNYYENHWRLMRGKDENAWLEFKLRVLVALTIVKEPVSLDFIEHFTKVKSRSRIHAVIEDWKQFLYEEKVSTDSRPQTRYRVYHSSFRDFIASKEQISEEKVSLKRASEEHSETLLRDLYGKGPEIGTI